MIDSIRLVNWRSHKDSRLEFRKGTNLLIGIMGAGKSSVLEAIVFSLFGTFPALERRKVKLENLIRLNEPEAKIVIEFSSGGSKYRVERSVGRKKTSAEVFKDENLVENGTIAVTNYVESILQVDYDLFSRAIYSEQNNIEYFLNLDPRRRKQEIDSLLGLDRFETARSNLTSVIGRIRERKKSITYDPSRLSEIEGKMADSLEKRKKAEAQLAEIRLSLEQKEKILKEEEKKFNDLKSIKGKFEEFQKEQIRLKAQKESAEKGLVPVDQAELDSLSSSLESLEKQKAALSSETESLLRRISGISKEIGSIQFEIKNSRQLKSKREKLLSELKSIQNGSTEESLASMLEVLEKQVIELASEKRSIESSVIETLDIMKNLKPGSSNCPFCSTPLNDHSIENIRSEKEKFIEESKKKAQEIEKSIADATKAKLDIQKKADQIRSLKNSINSIQITDEVPMLQKEEGLLGELKTLEEKKSAQTKKQHELQESVSLVKEKKSKLVEMKSRNELLQEINLKIASLVPVEFDPAAYERSASGLEKTRIELQKLVGSLESINPQIRMLGDMLSHLEREHSMLKNMERESKLVSRMEEDSSIYRNVLLETQTGMRKSLIEAINDALNELWPVFYPYNNYSALRLNVTDKDYSFEVFDGAWKPLDLVASGGERASAALTLRVALAMVLTPNLSWLILDEPTHNLDKNAVESLSSALQYKVPEVVDQVFLITHDEGFIGTDFAMSYKLSRDKENNMETELEII